MAILKKGMNGAAVAELQRQLNKALRIVLLDDGDFGDKTDKALRQFQSKHGLLVDGEYGPITAGVLQKAIAPKPVGGYVITAELLAQCFKITVSKAAEYLPGFQDVVSRYDLLTANRFAMFCANLAHESGNLTVERENMNYSAKRLAQVWPKRYANAAGTPNALALSIAGNPEAVANNVYANRMGNGDAASGDGFKYRGGGLIQLTGKTNYQAFSNSIGVDLVINPDLIEEPRYAVLSAGWYWDTNNLNKWADKNDFDKVCDLINIGRPTEIVGDSIGWKDRKAKLAHMRQYIK
jgi:putative chitinase